MSKTPQTITVEESENLLATFALNSHNWRRTRKALRNKTMILLMLDAGLRVGEVCQLVIGDLLVFDSPVNTLVLPSAIAKNHKSRNIPLTERVKESIHQMDIMIWGPEITDCSLYAFYNSDQHKYVSRRQLQRIVSDHGMKATGRRIYPHMLRHTFATRLMRQVNARTVQELLGHKNIQTTQRYTHPDADDLKNAIDRLDKANGG